MTHIAVVPLGDIAELQAGVGFPPDLQGRPSGDYPLAKVGDISRLGRTGASVLNTADHFVDEADLARLKAKPIPVGSILFAKIGEAIRQNHRVIAGCELLVDNNAMAAIPTERVKSRYLFHFLRTVDFYVLASATTVPALRKSDLQRLLVPLPPLPEQRRIADILDKADALRAKRRAALAQLDTLTQSIFLDMFGDPATNPMGWPTASLQELGEISTGKTPPTRLEGMFGGDIPFATPGDLDVGLEYTQRTVTEAGAEHITIVRPGSALVGCIGNIGKMAKAPVRCAFNQQINAVEWAPRIDDDYGFAALGFTKVQMLALSSSTTVPILNKSGFSKVRIPVPPLERQREFAVLINRLSGNGHKCRASLSDLDALFASLQSRAFRGGL